MFAIIVGSMTSAALLFALVTNFSPFIDGLMAHRSFEFDITAQVALVSTNKPACAEIIGEYASNCWWNVLVPLPEGAPTALRVGDRVRLEGRYDAAVQGPSDNTPLSALSITRATSLGSAPFPASRRIDGSEISRGLRLRKIVSATGVLASVLRDEANPHFVWLIVRTPSGKFSALTVDSAFSVDELNGLKDAEVELSGLCEMTWGWRRFLGHRLLLFGRQGLKVVKPPPASPFEGETIGFNSTLPHRCREAGTVIGIGSRDVFIRQDDGKFLPVTLEAGAPSPRVGTHVEVGGFVECDLNNMRLVEAVVRPTGNPPAAPETPRDLDLGVLLDRAESASRMNADAYGRIIRFRGILNEPGAPANEARTLSVRCGARTVPLDVAALRGRLDARLRGGCEVEVSGICSVVFESGHAGALFPEFKGIVVIPRTGEDIRILRLPPWWTPARFAWAVGILLALLSGILLWNAALRRAVIRKSTALLREQVAKLEETLKVDERTRLAAELHDYLAQNLTVVSYRMSAALNAFRQGRADTAGYLESADRMLRSCRVDLRRCLWDLRSDTLDEPDFSRAVAKAVSPVSGKAAVHVRFGVRRAQLSDSTAHAVLSICRELVSNAVLHGRAETVRIAGEAKDGAINFSVRDDGCGFDPAARPGQAEGHFGLDGIAERVKRLDGSFALESVPGKGTHVRITLSQPRNPATQQPT